MKACACVRYDTNKVCPWQSKDVAVLPLEEALAEQGGVHCEAHRRLLDTLNFANVSNLCTLKGVRLRLSLSPEEASELRRCCALLLCCFCLLLLLATEQS